MANLSVTDVGVPAGTSPDLQAAKKTGYRWLVLFMIAMMQLITFMDRTNISIAAPAISREFGFTKIQMGFVFGAFAWAYAIAQIPGGWLGDKFGPRKVLTTVVIFWSLMTMATAHAWGFFSLVVIRFIFGLGEATAWPTSTQAMQFWYPKSERGLVNGVTHSCGNFATSVVPLVAVGLITAFGWRSVFYIFGAVGIVWSSVWWFVYRDRPEEHKRVNSAEAAYIRSGAPAVAATKKEVQIPWKLILGSPTTWILGLAWSAYTYTLFFSYYWLPTYLLEFRHISIKSMGVYASLPLFAGAVGVMMGGLITDFVYRKSGNLKWARRGVCIGALLLAAVSIIPAALLSKPVPVIICLILADFFVSLSSAPTWAVSMDIAGGYAGTVSAVMNMIGQFAGSLSAIVFGALTQRGLWVAPFYVTAGIILMASALWMFAINPERTVLERS